mgnify:CR=1 FL=1
MKLSKFLLAFFLLNSFNLSKAEPNDILELLHLPEHYALIRHALAPGTGDPSNFDLDDCKTQRNLSATGRKQSVTMGDLLREHGIEDAEILSSQWCRCKETAEYLRLGKVREFPALNSFFGRPQKKSPQLKALHTWFKTHTKTKPTLLVTHQVVITALTGVFPASGEMVVIKVDTDGDIKVMGRLKTL